MWDIAFADSKWIKVKVRVPEVDIGSVCKWLKRELDIFIQAPRNSTIFGDVNIFEHELNCAMMLLEERFKSAKIQEVVEKIMEDRFEMEFP